MNNAVRWIPEGYHSVTPYLIIRGAALAMGFYQRAFGAKELLRLEAPDGSVSHAEMRIGDSVVMFGEENIAGNICGPHTLGGAATSLLLYVEDVDAMVEQAVAAGAKLTRPLRNEFYGDRTARVEDPFGHAWFLATHIEDVSQEEMQRRMAGG